jgi:muramoyltetrapeptide carboxypeptidase LdcA involved in peptidoglycan recycling
VEPSPPAGKTSADAWQMVCWPRTRAEPDLLPVSRSQRKRALAVVRVNLMGAAARVGEPIPAGTGAEPGLAGRRGQPSAGRHRGDRAPDVCAENDVEAARYPWQRTRHVRGRAVCPWASRDRRCWCRGLLGARDGKVARTPGSAWAGAFDVGGSQRRMAHCLMVRELIQPQLLRPGDRVAVLSPSWAVPAAFPAVHEQAMRRLREVVGVEPVEFPSTRRESSARARAHDLNAAFADPSIRAVLATIGGDDHITVLPGLDRELPRRDPKPFVGYADNTNLLNWLWFHGVASCTGLDQVHLGPGPAVDERHLRSLRAALFTGDVALQAVERSRDIGIAWDDPRALTELGPDQPAEPWTWSGPAQQVVGPTWGGNLEVLTWTLAASRWVLPNEAYAGCVLVPETSEERPSPREVYRMMRNLGERGLLGVFPALVWGRPPAGDRYHRPPPRRLAPCVRATARQSCGRRCASTARAWWCPGRRLRSHHPAVAAAVRRPDEHRRG